VGDFSSAPEGIRTPNLLIRSQVLYPLSYGRMVIQFSGLAVLQYSTPSVTLHQRGGGERI
jgi:hypothetical protein